jgi:hypothetical protein
MAGGPFSQAPGTILFHLHLRSHAEGVAAMSADIKGKLAPLLRAEEMHDPDERADVLQIAQAYVKLVDSIARYHDQRAPYREEDKQDMRNNSTPSVPI